MEIGDGSFVRLTIPAGFILGLLFCRGRIRHVIASLAGTLDTWFDASHEQDLYHFRNLCRERHSSNAAGGATALETKEIW